MTSGTSGAGTATLPEHLRSIPFLVGVRVTRSLVLYVCIVDRCLSFCPFSFGHPSIYGFWLPLLYLQNVLKEVMIYNSTNINNTNICRRGCRLWFETCKQIWRNQTIWWCPLRFLRKKRCSIRLYSHSSLLSLFTVFRLMTDFVCLYTYEFL